jgi:hypothetical protein
VSAGASISLSSVLILGAFPALSRRFLGAFPALSRGFRGAFCGRFPGASTVLLEAAVWRYS